MKRFLIVFLITLCLGFSAYYTFNYWCNNQEKNGYRDVHGIVYDKMGEQKSRYKSTKIYTDFILVVQDKDTNKYFDIKVTPTTYSTHNIGDNIYFIHLSKSIIGEKYEEKDHLLFLSLLLGLLTIGGISFIIADFTDCDNY